MTITSKKKTKVSTSVSWRKNLVDGVGNTFAYMTATIDEHRPLGSTTFSVTNQDVYEANLPLAQSAYEAFQSEVFAAAKRTKVTSESTEETED